MKILYIHQYFKTPKEGGAIRSYYLAKGLLSYGFDVELITSHNEKKYAYKVIDGIKVHYLPVTYDNGMGFMARLFSFLNFFLRATFKAIAIRHINLLYATSTPLTVGCIGLIIKKWKKIPYVFEVRDLWPEAPIQMGIIKNAFLKFLLYRLEVAIYKEAEAIVALSPGIQAFIQRKSPNSRVDLIPNMSDIHFFRPSANKGSQKADNKEFTILYFGAIGKVNRVDYLLDIAKVTKIKLPSLRFTIVGTGSELKKLKNLKELHGLSNVEIIGFRSKFQVREILKTVDASYITYENLPVLESSSPNKFFDSIAAGKLIILNIRGWLVDLCEENKCGIFVDPATPEEFVSKILPFLEDREFLKTYQENALKLAAKSFSKEAQIITLAQILSEIMRPRL